MFAIKLFGANDVRLVECEIPKIEEEEILVKTCVAAICGSDLRMIKNGYQGVDEEHPLILGHEISGEIVKVGEKVSYYKEGMQVVIAPNFGCGECDFCQEGNSHLCSNYQAFGINIDGGFAEYVRIPKEAVRQGNVICIDEKTTMRAAALVEPAACVLNGQEKIEIHEKDCVLIVGAGPIGVLHAMLAKAQGAHKIIVSDLSRDRLNRAAKAASFIITATPERAADIIDKESNGKGVDVCITACASKDVQEKTFSIMNTKGRILFFGGLPKNKDEIKVHSNLLHYKELKLCGSTRCSGNQCKKIYEMVKEGQLSLEDLITKEFAVHNFLEAFAYAESAVGLKTIICFGKEM